MRQKGDTNYVGLCAFRSRPMSVHVTAELGCRWHSSGGQEAHLVADELAKSSIAVILSPPRAFPESWDARRALPGPPLTHDSRNFEEESGLTRSFRTRGTRAHCCSFPQLLQFSSRKVGRITAIALFFRSLHLLTFLSRFRRAISSTASWL